MARANQIAISVSDMRRSLRFYRSVFGLAHLHGTRTFRGPRAERVQGIPGVASNCQWMNDGREYFQLELFAFEAPAPRPLPVDARASDIGYARLAMHVRDLDSCARAAKRLGSRMPWPQQCIDGRRHLALCDPDGILIELIEAPERLAGASAAQLAGIALSVPSLLQARAAFCAGLRLQPADSQPVARDALWGMPGASCRALRLDAATIWIELVQYERPAPRPRLPDHRISDVGILNFALGSRDPAFVHRAHAQALAAGFSANCEPVCVGDDLACAYLADPQGFSVELLASHPRHDRRIGFARPDWRTRMQGWRADWQALRGEPGRRSAAR